MFYFCRFCRRKSLLLVVTLLRYGLDCVHFCFKRIQIKVFYLRKLCVTGNFGFCVNCKFLQRRPVFCRVVRFFIVFEELVDFCLFGVFRYDKRVFCLLRYGLDRRHLVFYRFLVKCVDRRYCGQCVDVRFGLVFYLFDFQPVFRRVVRFLIVSENCVDFCLFGVFCRFERRYRVTLRVRHGNFALGGNAFPCLYRNGSHTFGNSRNFAGKSVF